MNSVQNSSKNVERVCDLPEEQFNRVAGYIVKKARIRMNLYPETYQEHRQDMFQEAYLSLVKMWESPVNRAIYRAIFDQVEYMSCFGAEIPKGLNAEERKSYKEAKKVKLSLDDKGAERDAHDVWSYKASPYLRLMDWTDTRSPEDWLILQEERQEREIAMQGTRRVIYKMLYDAYQTQRDMRALTFADILHGLLEGESKRGIYSRVNLYRNAFHGGIKKARNIIEMHLEEQDWPHLEKCSWCEEAQVCQTCHCCQTAVCNHCCSNPKLKKNPQARYCPLCSDKYTRKFIWTYLSA